MGCFDFIGLLRILKKKDKVYHCYCPNFHLGNFGVMTTYGGDPK